MKRYKVDPDTIWKVLAGTEHSDAIDMVLNPGKSTGGPDNRHRLSDQWMFVISGRGEAIVDTQRVELEERTLLLIEAGEAHEIKNAAADQPLEAINFYAPKAY
jgi:mannose-6-phosphate isomerase-like protein (cupin superfamily)